MGLAGKKFEGAIEVHEWEHLPFCKDPTGTISIDILTVTSSANSQFSITSFMKATCNYSTGIRTSGKSLALPLELNASAAAMMARIIWIDVIFISFYR